MPQSLAISITKIKTVSTHNTTPHQLQLHCTFKHDSAGGVIFLGGGASRMRTLCGHRLNKNVCDLHYTRGGMPVQLGKNLNNHYFY